jgi:DNA-binding response OmpR family regulator
MKTKKPTGKKALVRKTVVKKKSSAPKAAAPLQVATQAAAVEPLGKTIMIVEDEDAMGKVLSNKFASSGFTVKRCYNGKEALDILTKEKVDLIMLDLLMPGKDGFAVLGELASTVNKYTPVYILTNLGDDDTVNRVRDMGARDCFIKSRTSLNDLVQKMRVTMAE